MRWGFAAQYRNQSDDPHRFTFHNETFFFFVSLVGHPPSSQSRSRNMISGISARVCITQCPTGRPADENLFVDDVEWISVGRTGVTLGAASVIPVLTWEMPGRYFPPFWVAVHFPFVPLFHEWNWKDGKTEPGASLCDT